MAAANVTTLSCLNPINHSVSVMTVNKKLVKDLQTICFENIRKVITIGRFNQLSALPLPPLMINQLHDLCLNHFYINPDAVTSEYEKEKTYPAKCLVDDRDVLLHVRPLDYPIPPEPSYITSFVCQGMACHIYHQTYSLSDLVRKCRLTNSSLDEMFIWKMVYQISLVVSNMSPEIILKPKLFHFFQEQLVYKPSFATDSSTIRATGMAMAFYTAPEVYNQVPESIFSQSWAIGCFIYEMMALEPAFYDRSETGDIMSVMMGIVEGVPPPMPTGSYSPELFGLMAACLQKDPPSRPSPGQIFQFSQSKFRN